MNDDKKTASDKLRERVWTIIIYLIVFLGSVMFVVLLAVAFSDYISCFIKKWLDTNGRKEILEFFGWGIGGIIASYGLVTLSERATAQAKSASEQVETNKLTEKGHIQDRFIATVEHLSSKEPSARIASFYEFFYLAKDEKRYIQSILDILCAHFRHISNSKNPEENPPEEIKTLISILFSREATDIFGKLDYDLQRANLNEIDFQKIQKSEGKIDFSFAKLVEANFNEADLSGSKFQESSLIGAYLWKAILRKAILRKAILQGADLQEADLQEADLWGANLNGAWMNKADLQKVNLQEAKLRKAKLQKANLQKVNLQGADLRKANLREANFREAENLETALLSEAIYDDETKFPEGFDPAAHGMVKYNEEDE